MNIKKKGVLSTANGRRSSKHDVLIEEFKDELGLLVEGQTIWVECNGPTASQIAKRLCVLSGKKFHSFKDVLEKCYAVRLRIEGELDEDEDE